MNIFLYQYTIHKDVYKESFWLFGQSGETYEVKSLVIYINIIFIISAFI